MFVAILFYMYKSGTLSYLMFDKVRSSFSWLDNKENFKWATKCDVNPGLAKALIYENLGKQTCYMVSFYLINVDHFGARDF